MILNCPSCGARFLVDPTQIGPEGRQVRCGQCGHAWQQMAPPPLQESPPAAPAGSAIPPLEEFDAARRRSSGPQELEEGGPRPSKAAIGWAALAVFIVALTAGAWFGRQAIVARLPEAARLYELVGLPIEPAEQIGEGLKLRDVTSVKRLVDGERTLLIEGAVVNVSDKPRPVPALKAILTDAEGIEVAQWTFAPAGEALPPGGTTTFQTSTQDPPREGNLSLVFVERE